MPLIFKSLEEMHATHIDQVVRLAFRAIAGPDADVIGIDKYIANFTSGQISFGGMLREMREMREIVISDTAVERVAPTACTTPGSFVEAFDHKKIQQLSPPARHIFARLTQPAMGKRAI